MPISFTLEKRTNSYDEHPIRLSWKFGESRFQTTLGFSVKQENWDVDSRLVISGSVDHNNVQADEVNHYIKRIKGVSEYIERQLRAQKLPLFADQMTEIIKMTVHTNSLSDVYIAQQWMEMSQPVENTQVKYYYHQSSGKIYRFVCYATYPNNVGDFSILTELPRRKKNIIVPTQNLNERFRAVEYKEISENEALKMIEKEFISHLAQSSL